MRKTTIGFMLVILVIYHFLTLSLTYAEQSKDSQRISTIENQVKSVSESVTEIRRDQLNYKIEKDLLKETYSSNVTTINLIITLILGSFAVFGYLGVKGIGALKTDFKQELEKLSGLRREFENKITEVNRQIETANIKIKGMAKVNVDQDRRLSILELQEKCSSLYTQKNYARALEYANLGLKIDDKDSLLIAYKGLCQMKMGSLKEACETMEIYNNISPGNIAMISNLIEISVLVGKLDQAQFLLKANEGALQTVSGPYLSWYIKAMVYFFSGSIPELRAHLLIQPAPITEDKAFRIKGQWSFNETLAVVERTPTRSGYKEIKTAIEFLQGNIGHTELNTIITSVA